MNTNNWSSKTIFCIETIYIEATICLTNGQLTLIVWKRPDHVKSQVMTRAWSHVTRDTQRKCDISLEFMRLTHWAVTRVCWVNVQIGIYIRLLCYSPGHVTPTHYDKLKWLHKLYIASNTQFIAILSNNTFVVTLSSLEYKTRIRIWLMLCTLAASGARSSAW